MATFIKFLVDRRLPQNIKSSSVYGRLQAMQVKELTIEELKLLIQETVA